MDGTWPACGLYFLAVSLFFSRLRTRPAGETEVPVTAVCIVHGSTVRNKYLPCVYVHCCTRNGFLFGSPGHLILSSTNLVVRAYVLWANNISLRTVYDSVYQWGMTTKKKTFFWLSSPIGRYCSEAVS